MIRAYENKEGFPPLRIKGKDLSVSSVNLKANVSSQYISALLLIASQLGHGLELTLDGKITSVPYIKMTLSLLEEIGVNTSFEGQVIKVLPLKEKPLVSSLTVESDWSSASYFYTITALSEEGTELTLSAYKKNSLQGDSVLVDVYKAFGVETTFDKHSITLKKSNVLNSEAIMNLDLANAPDIAQTIAVQPLV